jgi:rRNA processing protein Krr1/Pno1
MPKIDCTAVPSEVTDFAFDQIQDRLEQEDWEAITVDYDAQIVTVESTDRTVSSEEHPEPHALEEFVQAIISSFSIEKANHMKMDAEDDYVETSYTAAEMQQVREDLVHGCIQIVDEE